MSMKFTFLKNYFLIFFLTYSILITTKILFTFYLQANFTEFSISQELYAIFWGFRFDFATCAIIAFIITLFDFNKKIFTLSATIVLITVFFTQIGDILYFNEANRHIGYEITDTITDASSLFMTAYSQHTILTIISIFTAFSLSIFIRKILLNKQTISINRFYILKKLVLIILTIFFIRGMTQSIPLNPWQSNQIGDSKLATLSLNATYNIIYSLVNKNKKLQPIKIPTISEKTIRRSFKELYQKKEANIDFPIIKTKPNIVFLFLESWSAVYLQAYGYKYNTTPYFSEILKKSIRPAIMIASGHRTTEGMFSTLASFQNPLGKTVAKTQLQNHQYSSIINILNQKDYNSAFFQGSSKETSGTGSFAQSMGYKYSYGKKDIKERIYEENYWGVHDVDLYNFVEKNLSSQLKEPFIIGINGATTHDDKIPKGIKKIHFTDEKINNQLNALHFSDLALKQFITNVENKYPNTIFVLLADHCGGNISVTIENYMIPFAIYSKKLIVPKYHDIYLSQRDIAPTIYDLTIGNYKNHHTTFSGKSLIQDSSFFADYYHNGILGWTEDNSIIEINTSTNIMICYKKSNLNKEKTNCTKVHNEMKNRALSFTNVSQKLLFSDTLNSFKKYRNIHEN